MNRGGISLQMLSLWKTRICKSRSEVDGVMTGGELLFVVICKCFHEICFSFVLTMDFLFFMIMMESIRKI